MWMEFSRHSIKVNPQCFYRQLATHGITLWGSRSSLWPPPPPPMRPRRPLPASRAFSATFGRPSVRLLSKLYLKQQRRIERGKERERKEVDRRSRTKRCHGRKWLVLGWVGDGAVQLARVIILVKDRDRSSEMTETLSGEEL
jgi:hypothetical protein